MDGGVWEALGSVPGYVSYGVGAVRGAVWRTLMRELTVPLYVLLITSGCCMVASFYLGLIVWVETTPHHKRFPKKVKDRFYQSFIVNVARLKEEGMSHDPDVKKRVILKDGMVPYLTNFSQTTIRPGDACSEHRHATMHEVFLVEKGAGTFRIDGEDHAVRAGDCVYIAPTISHAMSNPKPEGADAKAKAAQEDLVLTYMSITDPSEFANPTSPRGKSHGFKGRPNSGTEQATDYQRSHSMPT